MSTNGRWDSRREAKLATVRALLAKAERTKFSEEARALTGKAQELMARYAFTEAHLDSLGDRTRDEIVTVVVKVERPYQSAKGLILSQVGEAHRCVVVETRGRDGLDFHVTGFRSDVERAQLLFTSLLVQAAREMLAAPMDRWLSPRSFRHAFLVGYSAEIGSRLATQVRAAEDSYRTETGFDLLPVLADRREQVEEAVEERWSGRLRSSRVSYQGGVGYARGRQAGRRADLGNRRLGTRRALARR